MNYSILNKISEYVKNNKITIKGVYYKIDDFFPKAFKDSITNLFELIYSSYGESNPIFDGFYVNIDENDNIFLEVVSKNNTRIVIIQDFTYYKNLPPAIKVKESQFLDKFMYFDKRNYLDTLNSLPYDFKKRFLKPNNYENTINELFENITNRIISYIEYVQKEKELADEQNIEKIFYIESEKSSNRPNSRVNNSHNTNSRKHPELSIEERTEVLNSYSPSQQFEATASNTDSVYHVKVFKVKEKCKLIMEPKEGTKYTKVVYLDLEKINQKDIKDIVINSLQLSRNEITKKDNITRHSHTTLEEYKKLIEYLINENDTGLNKSTKDRIDEANKIR